MHIALAQITPAVPTVLHFLSGNLSVIMITVSKQSETNGKINMAKLCLILFLYFYGHFGQDGI